MNHISLKLLIVYSLALFLLWQCTNFLTAAPASSFSAGNPFTSSVKRSPRLTSLGSGGAYTSVQTYPANCKGTRTTGIESLKYFRGLLQSDLNMKYINNNEILCYDNWKSTWSNSSSSTYRSDTFLKIVGWPQDFFTTKKDVTLIVTPIAGPNLVASPKTTTTTQDDNEPHNSCDWVPDLVVAHPHIDICAFFQQILNSNVAQPLESAFNQVSSQANSFLWSTPAKDTYQNQEFEYFWNLSLWLVNAYLVVVLAWVALRGSIIKTFNWLSYADVLEYLPRIGFGLLLAYSSTHLIQIVIDGSNALCSIFNHALFDSFTNASNATDIVSIVLHIVYLIMGLLLILEEGARYSILFVIIAFFPILVFTASLRETQFISRAAIRGFVFMTLLQPVQMAVMAVGVTVLKTILNGEGVGSILNYLVSIGLMIFVLSLFFSFFRMAFGSISTPFVAAASGLAAVSAGKSLQGAVQGGRAIMAGRAAIQQGVRNITSRRRAVNTSNAGTSNAGSSGYYGPSTSSMQYIKQSAGYKTARASNYIALVSATSSDKSTQRIPTPKKAKNESEHA